MNADIVSVDPALQPKLNGRFGFRAYKIGLAGPSPGPHHPLAGSPVVARVFLQGAVARSPDYVVPPGHLKPICTLPEGWRPKEERWFTCQICSYLREHDGQPTLGVVHPDGVVAVALPDGRFGVDGAVFFDEVAFFVER